MTGEKMPHADYFLSKEHEEWMMGADIAMFGKLQRIAEQDKEGALFRAVSDAMGTSLAVARFYKALGFKHQYQQLADMLLGIVNDDEVAEASE